jgi:hypothetical protein
MRQSLRDWELQRHRTEHTSYSTENSEEPAESANLAPAEELAMKINALKKYAKMAKIDRNRSQTKCSTRPSYAPSFSFATAGGEFKDGRKQNWHPHLSPRLIPMLTLAH